MQKQRKKNLTDNFLRQLRRRWNSWLTCTVLSVVLIIYIALQQEVFSGYGTRDFWRIACDGCFVCALIYFSLFIIALCVRNGAFSFFRYGASSLSDSFSRRKGEEVEKRYEDFADYLKKTSSKKRNSPALLVFAAGFLVLGIAFLLLYMR